MRIHKITSIISYILCLGLFLKFVLLSTTLQTFGQVWFFMCMGTIFMLLYETTKKYPDIKDTSLTRMYIDKQLLEGLSLN